MNLNEYIPDHDITEKLPDGRNVLIWAAGKPMDIDRAVALGLIERRQPVVIRPSETKTEAEPEPEPLPPAADRATPGALALAKKNKLDIDALEGTGIGGRITKRDVEALLK